MRLRRYPALLSLSVATLVGFVACSTNDEGGGGGEADAGDAGAFESDANGGVDAAPTPTPDAATPDAATPDAADPNGRTDVSCGGSLPPACDEGKKCKLPRDCTSLSCASGVCAAPTATDGVKNGDESDVDCGGTSSPKCEDGKTCTKSEQCTSALCSGTGKCAAPSVDGVKNGDETDVDCGGAASPKCEGGKACVLAANCSSGVCTALVCQEPSPTDGVKNGDETDMDCGGATAPKCIVGKICSVGGDCESGSCKNALCAAPAPDDGVKNGDETDVDCGGATAPKCDTGLACASGADCKDKICSGGTCAAPSFTDGVQNGTESDVDCGGTATYECGNAKSCVANADCKSQRCDGGKCRPRTCAGGGNGKATCGTAAASNEDCCTAITVPGAGPVSTFQVDKFLVTSGRMRAFLEAVDGKVRDHITNNKPSWWKDEWTAFLPNSWDGRELINGFWQVPPGEHLNIYSTYAQVSGGIIHDAPGNQGCFIGNSYGHPTYFVPASTHTMGVRNNVNGASQIWGDNYTRWMGQARLDQRPLNCTPELLFAALCAYDGGEVISEQEWRLIYDADGNPGTNVNDNNVTTYPWGSPPALDCTADAGSPYRTTPNPIKSCVAPAAGYDPATNPHPGGFSSVPLQAGGTQWSRVGPGRSGFTQNLCAAGVCPNGWVPWSFSYQDPAAAPANATQERDQSYFIPVPGRFPNGASRSMDGTPGARVQDITGTMIHITRTPGTTPAANTLLTFGNADAGDDRTVVLDTVRWRGGSWEGHGLRDRWDSDFRVVTKYGKAGSRCVYR